MLEGNGVDMALKGGAGIVTLENGASAVFVKSGLTQNDTNFLVARLREGDNWLQACTKLQRAGTIAPSALEGWREECIRQAALDPNRRKSFSDLNQGTLVLPVAKNPKEQCTYIFDVPQKPGEQVANNKRCILKRHEIGGHVPGIPMYAEDYEPHQPSLAEKTAMGPVVDTEEARRLLSKVRHAPEGNRKPVKAKTPADQCRYIGSDGNRCLFVLNHSGEDHLLIDVKKPSPRRKYRRRQAKKSPETVAAASATEPPKSEE